MARVGVVGDGPAGLSAALFLARGGQQVTVFGQDQTAMHYALLNNYLGIPQMTGSEFQRVARDQVAAAGATILAEEVSDVRRAEAGFVVVAGEDAHPVDYLLLAGGKAAQRLAQQLGLIHKDGRVITDLECRTDIDRLYAAGRVVRPNRSQAIISAGAGATAALDILSREAGRDVTDWDSPPETR